VIVKILIESGELDRVPPNPDAKLESPAAQHIKRRGLRRHQISLTLRQDQHLG